MKATSVRPSARQSILQEDRLQKMASSVQAYMRGSPQKFYAWLRLTTSDRIPQGPPVWICGDCHVGNLGPVANRKDRVEIAVRDLDQTVIGNPAHDLIRLGLSLAIAMRSSDLPGVTTAIALEQMIEGYDEALSHPAGDYSDFQHVPKSVRAILSQAIKREWRHVAKKRVENASPNIPLGKCFWPLSRSEKAEIERVFETEDMHHLVTSLRGRKHHAKVHVVDAAYWVKGCSSLGRLRYAVLLRIGKRSHQGGEMCLIDIKEAIKAAAPRTAHRSMPRNNAKRVVQGACKLSPFLGNRMLAATFLDREVFIRELMPQDLRIELAQLTQENAIEAARYLAAVVGKAHGRQMDVQTRQKWRAELRSHRLRNLNAPSWLWRSVVELAAIHEAAYLEHCREYAMKKRPGVVTHQTTGSPRRSIGIHA